ncbi:type II secretion system F family protein [Kitasatospora sp. NPDC001540]|uniref:type II secretion system F family protein n=1 Tax=Kitasatospora sp. NPDC001540 TaxID=3364014 RepID=UPI00368BF438
MIQLLTSGAVVGLGLFLLVRALLPSRPGAVAAVARVDALRSATAPAAQAPARAAGAQGWAAASVGPAMAAFYARRGWHLSRLRPDLAMLERSKEEFLAQKVLFAAAGLLLGPAIAVVLSLADVIGGVTVPLWVTVLMVVLCFFAPDLEVRSKAKEERREFRRIVSVYLTLVHLSLSGGSGLPEAMKSTAEASATPQMRRIRLALEGARVSGIPYWQAPGRLGEEIALPELIDFTRTVARVAQDGAKVRQSLQDRAETLRKRELADLESAAAAKSQSMLVAQMMLCFGFLIFLIYPALTQLSAM